MDIEVRRAVVADAEAAATCHMLCWREAYADVIEHDKLIERTSNLDGRIAYWRQSLEDGAERWVALHPSGDEVPVTERVIGFSAPGLCRDEDAPRNLELYAIYVRRAWWDTGLGSRLLEVAIGNEPALLWTYETNDRARRFYARHGFVPDGARMEEASVGLQRIRMVR